MKFLPFENITYKTTLSVNEVVDKLKGQTEAQRFAMTKRRSNKRFRGIIHSDSFSIVHNSSLKNSFNPMIEGKIMEGPKGANVHIKMHLNALTLVFIAFFATIALFVLGITTYQSIKSQEFDNLLFFPIGLLVALYLITMMGFKLESYSVKKYLERLLASKMEQ